MKVTRKSDNEWYLKHGVTWVWNAIYEVIENGKKKEEGEYASSGFVVKVFSHKKKHKKTCITYSIYISQVE